MVRTKQATEGLEKTSNSNCGDGKGIDTANSLCFLFGLQLYLLPKHVEDFSIFRNHMSWRVVSAVFKNRNDHPFLTNVAPERSQNGPFVSGTILEAKSDHRGDMLRERIFNPHGSLLFRSMHRMYDCFWLRDDSAVEVGGKGQ